VKSYRDLIVWQKAMDLVVESYRLSRLLPRPEVYGLASQMQRAAVSVPANIAEGHGREHLGDYIRHLSIATGSLETHLLIALRLGYLTEDDVRQAMATSGEVSRMLSSLTKKLRNLTPNT
jgi:four helix bundle protein